jgi:hypothetical protein
MFVLTLAAVAAFSVTDLAQADSYTAFATGEQAGQDPPVETDAVSLATFHFIDLFGAELLVTLRFDGMYESEVQGASIRVAGSQGGNGIGDAGNGATQFNNTNTEFNNTNTEFSDNNTQFSNTTTQFGSGAADADDDGETASGDGTNNGDPGNDNLGSGDNSNGSDGSPNESENPPSDDGTTTASGDVALDFSASGFALGSLVINISTAADLAGPLEGQTLDDLQELFDSGQAFLVVSTADHPNGETRGQIRALATDGEDQDNNENGTEDGDSGLTP